MPEILLLRSSDKISLVQHSTDHEDIGILGADGDHLVGKGALHLLAPSFALGSTILEQFVQQHQLRAVLLEMDAAQGTVDTPGS